MADENTEYEKLESYLAVSKNSVTEENIVYARLLAHYVSERDMGNQHAACLYKPVNGQNQMAYLLACSAESNRLYLPVQAKYLQDEDLRSLVQRKQREVLALSNIYDQKNVVIFFQVDGVYVELALHTHVNGLVRNIMWAVNGWRDPYIFFNEDFSSDDLHYLGALEEMLWFPKAYFTATSEFDFKNYRGDKDKLGFYRSLESKFIDTSTRWYLPVVACYLSDRLIECQDDPLVAISEVYRGLQKAFGDRYDSYLPAILRVALEQNGLEEKVKAAFSKTLKKGRS